MKSLAVALNVICLAAVSGCASSNSYPVETAGQVKVILKCNVKETADSRAVLHAANDLAKVKGILDVSAGHPPVGLTIKSTSRPANVLDENPVWPLYFILTLRDETALADLTRDAAYQRVQRDIFAPTCTSVTLEAFTLENYLISEQFTEETTAATLERRAAAMRESSNAMRAK